MEKQTRRRFKFFAYRVYFETKFCISYVVNVDQKLIFLQFKIFLHFITSIFLPFPHPHSIWTTNSRIKKNPRKSKKIAKKSTKSPRFHKSFSRSWFYTLVIVSINAKRVEKPAVFVCWTKLSLPGLAHGECVNFAQFCWFRSIRRLEFGRQKCCGESNNMWATFFWTILRLWFLAVIFSRGF